MWIAPHSAVLGNLDLVVTSGWENSSSFLFILRYSKFKQVLKQLSSSEFDSKILENHCHFVDPSQFPKTLKTPYKTTLETTVLKTNQWKTWKACFAMMFDVALCSLVACFYNWLVFQHLKRKKITINKHAATDCGEVRHQTDLYLRNSQSKNKMALQWCWLLLYSAQSTGQVANSSTSQCT